MTDTYTDTNTETAESVSYPLVSHRSEADTVTLTWADGSTDEWDADTAVARGFNIPEAPAPEPAAQRQEFMVLNSDGTVAAVVDIYAQDLRQGDVLGTGQAVINEPSIEGRAVNFRIEAAEFPRTGARRSVGTYRTLRVAKAS